MVTVEVIYENGVELSKPKTYTGRLCQYARPFANSSGKEVYLVLRDDNGTSIAPPLYNFSRPIFTEDTSLGTKMKFMGDEIVSSSDGQRKKYRQMWVIDFCGDSVEVEQAIAMADQIGGRVHVQEDATPEAEE